MTILYLFIALVFFDVNMGMANSASRVISIIFFVYILFERRFKVRISKLSIIQTIILLALGLSVFVHKGSTRELILIAEQLIIYIAAYNYIDNEDKSVKTLKCISCIGTTLALIGTVEYVFFEQLQSILQRFRTIEIGLYYENGYGRISSTFINPIYFSAILIVTIFVSQALNRSDKKWYWKISFTISLIALILTRSEGGIIAFLIIEILLNLTIIRDFFTKYSVAWKLIVLILVGVIVLYTVAYGVERSTLISIFTARVYAWIAAIRIFLHNIFIGCGLGNFDSLFRVYASEFIRRYYFVHYAPHSDFFTMLANGGLIATIPFVYYIVYQIRISRKALHVIYECNPNMKVIINGCAFVIIYFSIHRMIDDFYYTYRVSVIINILIAMFERLTDSGSLELL